MKNYLDFIFDGIACIGTAVQFEDVELVFRIVALVLTIASIICSLIFKIIVWKKKAMEDGKIDEKEVKELKDIIDETKDELPK